MVCRTSISRRSMRSPHFSRVLNWASLKPGPANRVNPLCVSRTWTRQRAGTARPGADLPGVELGSLGAVTCVLGVELRSSGVVPWVLGVEMWLAGVVTCVLEVEL